MEGKRRALDAEQSKVVSCDGNAVVSAGAGSGKTTVLAERYLRLIREGRATVEEILTLTFTRKAAAEMYERIYSLLIADGSPAAQTALANFDRAAISTLDSFCAQIARDWSQRFGVARNFRIADEAVDDGLSGLSLRFLLEHYDREALGELIHVNGFEAVWKDFFASIARTYLTVAEEKDFGAMAAGQVAELRSLLAEKLASLIGFLGQIRGIEPGSGKAVRDSQEMIARLPDLEELARKEAWRELRSALDGLKLNLRTGNSASEELVRFKEAAREMNSLRESLGEIVSTLASSSFLLELFELIGLFQGEVLDYKRRTGLLAFHDVVDMAVAILTENVELRGFYAGRYRYIMIDEFQDNNSLQKQLLYLLAARGGHSPGASPPGPEALEPGKLFFVGDEKQSIYRFRGADVSVFRSLASELTAHGGSALRLSANYRSAPALVAFFNRLFPAVMADPVEDFEARFEPLVAGLPVEAGGAGIEQGSSTALEAPVRLFLKPYSAERPSDAAENDDAEALHITRFIYDMVEKRRLILREGGRERPAAYEDFALLMRSTSNQIRYERLFRRFGIPYSTQGVRTLFLEAPLNDLYCALQVALYPEDRGAFAALLRSPFVNLSDELVVRLLLADVPSFDLPDGAPEPAPAEKRKLERGSELVEHLRERADLVPLAELLHELWYRFGYRYLLMRNRGYHGYLEYYDYFKRLAERFDAEGAGLAAFLDYVRPNLGKYERLPELSIVQDNPTGVQLLTIHKAKGLEFPVVILANAGNSGRGSSEAGAPYYLAEGRGLTVRISSGGNYFYSLGRKANRRKELAEAKRLLYVALTRARSLLVISGCHNRNNRPGSDRNGAPKNEEVLLNMVLGGLGWSPEAPESEIGIPVELIPETTESDLFVTPLRGPRSLPEERLRSLVDHYASAPVVDRSPSQNEWSASGLNELHRELASEAGAAPRVSRPLPALPSDPLIEREQLGEPFGSLCHFAIEQALAGRPLEAPSLLRELPARLREQLSGSLSASELSRLAADARELAERFLLSELGREALAASRESESAFLYRFDVGERRHLISGQFDLLFLRNGGAAEAVIVDFKTDSLVVEGAYDVQMQLYRAAATELTGRPARSLLCYLRDGSLHEVSVSIDLGALITAALDRPD